MSGSSSLYKSDSKPQDYMCTLAANISESGDVATWKESYGIDAPLGAIASLFCIPMYMYATLKGKFKVWDDLLDQNPCPSESPSLDVGCGRGMILLKLALKKRSIMERHNREEAGPTPLTAITPNAKAYGIDIFSSIDQTGNSPNATFKNALALGLTPYVVLHRASFAELPFADDVFGLVTASLVIHNASTKSQRKAGVLECARVVRPGGKLILVDMKGFPSSYEAWLREIGWTDLKRRWCGPRLIYGVIWCEALVATKPIGRCGNGLLIC